MGIDVDGKVMHLSFDDLINYKKRNNWRSQRQNGEWEDVCPECQEAE